MKDRIPKYPGRVRLTPVTGQQDVYDLVRADEPEQDGTPLNKATLLSDDTAKAIMAAHPGETVETVNDALRLSAKSSGGFAVQDTPPDNTKLGWVDTSEGGVMKYYDEISMTWKSTKSESIGSESSWTLLWENANPDSAFSAQTINIESLSNYNLFMVEAAYDNEYPDDVGSAMIYVPPGKEGQYLHVSVMWYGGGVILATWRRIQFYPSQDKITFSLGARVGPATYITDAKYAIPLRILGAKV